MLDLGGVTEGAADGSWLERRGFSSILTEISK